MWLSELYESDLIELYNKGADGRQIEEEWFKRWGLKFPYIRTAQGVIRYGEGKRKVNLERSALTG